MLLSLLSLLKHTKVEIGKGRARTSTKGIQVKISLLITEALPWFPVELPCQKDWSYSSGLSFGYNGVSPLATYCASQVVVSKHNLSNTLAYINGYYPII